MRTWLLRMALMLDLITTTMEQHRLEHFGCNNTTNSPQSDVHIVDNNTASNSFASSSTLSTAAAAVVTGGDRGGEKDDDAGCVVKGGGGGCTAGAIKACDWMHMLLSIGNCWQLMIIGHEYPFARMYPSQPALTDSHSDRHGGIVWSRQLKRNKKTKMKPNKQTNIELTRA